ncbi:MAG: GTP-binding protein, partial [Planctomycetota bacterium]
MADRTPDTQRVVALAGHGGSGKTTLAEHFLFKAGVTTRAGSVTDGTSNLDADPESKARKFTIDLAAATLSWKGEFITLLDTPGYSDFIAQAVLAFHAADAAVIVVNAGSGV